jgi:hypothetical protein
MEDEKMMKILTLVLGLMLVAQQTYAADCTWSAANASAERSVVGTGAIGCTFSTSAQGMDLSGVKGFSVEVCADSGQTIATAFSLSAWVRDPYLALWMPAPVWNLTSITTGVRCVYLDGWNVVSPQGRVGYSPSAGTVSSGSISIRITATGLGPYDGGELL